MDTRINKAYYKLCDDTIRPLNKKKILYIFCLSSDIYLFYIWDMDKLRICMIDEKTMTNIEITKVENNTYYLKSDKIKTIGIVKVKEKILGIINNDTKKIYVSLYDKILFNSIMNIYERIY